MLVLAHPLFLLRFDFNFFFHVNLLSMRVVEFVLEHGQFLVGNDFDSESVFHLPFSFHGHESLVNVGSDIGMQVDFEFLDSCFIDEVVNFAFQCICK